MTINSNSSTEEINAWRAANLAAWRKDLFIPKTEQSYNALKMWVHKNKITSPVTYRKMWRLKQLPSKFPKHPEHFFKEWYEGDNLFYNTLLPRILSYEDAKKLVRKLGIKTAAQYIKYTENQPEKMLMRLPRHPRLNWPEKWISYAEFFGTNNICKKKIHKRFLPYKEAMAYVHKLGLKDRLEWDAYCNSGKRPSYIPVSPWETYGKKFKGIRVWIGRDLVAAADVRENYNYSVFVLFHIPGNQVNVINFCVFDGGKHQAFDECKENGWNLLGMYAHEPELVSETMDAMRSNSSSVENQQMVVINYHQLIFELNNILMGVTL